MAITIHPLATPGTQLCLNALFKKRVFYRPIIQMSPYPAADGTPSCKERLAEAEACYHDLKLGRTVSVVHHDGRTLTFKPADGDGLWGYILMLRAECGTAADAVTNCGAGCGCNVCRPNRGRAFGMVF